MNPRSIPVLMAMMLAAATTPAAAGTAGWMASWASAQQVPEPQNAAPDASLNDATIREIVHLSRGGAMLRIKLSNAFGTQPLRFTAVHVARATSPGAARIDPATDRTVTFGGQPDVIVPAGADYLSDPVALVAGDGADLAISFHLADPPAGQTGHPGSRATTYFVHGDRTGAADLPGAATLDHWYQLSGVEVPGGAGTIVAFGDSITDGHASTTNGNDRWPDVLAARLRGQPATRGIAVVNEGIGGNHLLTDGLGPNALARFDRDVLAQAGARWLIVLEGINDIGGLAREHPVSAAEHAAYDARLIAALGQMIERAHERGIRVIGGTITPFEGSDYYHPDAAGEADRQAINRWIRGPGHFDAVIDFDAAIRDPAHPERMRPDYDSGDHLHPGPAGYRAMAEAIPLGLFAK